MRKLYKISLAAVIAITLFSCYDTSGRVNGISASKSGNIYLKNIPDYVSVVSGTGSAYLLFDGDTDTSGPVYTELAVKTKYNSTQLIKRIKIFDAGAGSVSVFDSGNSEIAKFKAVMTGSKRWITRELPESLSCDNLTFRINNTGSTNAVSEIELWTGDERVSADPTFVLKSSGNYSDVSALQIEETLGSTVRTYNCLQTVNKEGLKEFAFGLEIPATSFKRAIVKFNAPGLFRGVSASRSVNDHTFRTGFNIAYNGQTDQGYAFSDEINPMWLVTGNNTIKFSVPNGIEVSNVKVILFTDTGWNSVILTDEPTLFDGVESTGIKYFEGDSVEIGFEREVEPSDFIMNITGSARLAVEYMRDGEWYKLESDISTLNEGINLIKPSAQVKTSKLRLTFDGFNGAANVTLNEVKVSASPVGGVIIPRIVLNYPQNGEYFTNTAYIDGYVYPYGENISIEGFTDKRGSEDGSFSIAVDRSATRFSTTSADIPWYPVIKAVSDGVHISSEVSLYNNYNSTSSSGSTSSGTGTGSGGNGLQSDGSYSVTLTPDSSKTVDFNGVTIRFPAGAVKKSTTISIKPLAQSELAPLDPGMINVTWPDAGYRFLPHGKFEKDIEIVFKYARESLKAGMKDNDVFMYYYDETGKRWKRLDRIEVKPEIVTVVSKTNHFTDIINATLTVPEHPDALSYNPNTIKDLKAGDPSLKVNLIEAPKANSNGDANLSYPIELPKGRLGLAPSVSISYSSEGGNSWTGLGWSVSLQSVTVDTRFGVPRYDGNELYTLNGQQLAATDGSHDGAKIYRMRAEGSFSRIQRFGASPSDYYWVVTDKRGTKSYYGQKKTGGNISVLQNGSGTGPVYQWCLEKVVDIYGNCMNYYYSIDNSTFNGVATKQIYLSRITYTGRNGSDGRYSVHFNTSDGRRDVLTSARPGFMTATARRLDSINVSYMGATIRRYVLGYDYGPFVKTRLKTVSQYDGGGRLFNTHAFDYYEDVTGNNLFDTDVHSTIVDNLMTGDLTDKIFAVMKFYKDYLSNIITGDWEGVLSRSVSRSKNGFISIWFAPMSTQKRNAFGITIGAGDSKGEIKNTLIDIDGDSLPDLVYDAGESIKYKRNTGNGFEKEKNVQFLTFIGGDNSYSIFGNPDLPSYIPVNISVNFSKQYTYGYFTDVNGDGLPDFICAGGPGSSQKQIYYNITGNDGVVKFSDTPPGYSSGAIIEGNGKIPDLSGVDIGTEPSWDYLNNKFYLDDPLRIWKAPFTGIVKITGNIKISADSNPTGYTTDGVKVYIQKNNKLLWSDEVTVYKEGQPVGVGEIFVEKGDEIIFRVNSIDDGAYDIVEWDPLIEYTNEGSEYADEVDENGKNIYKYKSSEDFSLFGSVSSWIPYMNGIIKISVTASKNPTSDDVTVFVKRYTKESYVETDSLGNSVTRIRNKSEKIIYQKNYSFSDIVDENTVSLEESGITKYVIPDEGEPSEWDEIVVEVQSDTPVDAGKLNLKASVCYVYNSDGIDFKDQQTETLSYLNISFTNYRPLDEGSPNVPWIATDDGEVTFTYQVDSLYKPPFGEPPENLSVPIVIAVKKKNELVKKESGTITKYKDSVILSHTMNVTKGEKYYFVISSTYENFRQHVQVGLPVIQYKTKDAVNYHGYEYETRAFDTRLGGGWRNWYYARWCGNSDVLEQSKMLEVNNDNLKNVDGYTECKVGVQLTEDQANKNAEITNEMVKTFTNMKQASRLVDNGNSVIDESVIKKSFYEKDTIGLWYGNDTDCWISGGKMSSTRLAQKSITGERRELVDGDEGNFLNTTAKQADVSVFHGGAAIKKVSDTWNYTIGSGLGMFSGSLCNGKNKSSIDYFDMNGDRYPDIITNNTIQYTTKDGQFGEKNVYSGKGVHVSRTQTNNRSFSISQPRNYSVSINPNNSAHSTACQTIEESGQDTTSFSISKVSSTVISTAEFIDINGDGLPDYLQIPGEDGNIFTRHGISDYDSSSDILINYNLGYSFVAGNSMPFGDYINRSELIGGSPLTVGVTWDKNRFSAGGSLNVTNNRVVLSYTDVNGDGLPDKVRVAGDMKSLIIRYNTGTSFSDEFIQPINSGCISSMVNNSAGINGSGSIWITIWIPFTPIFFTIGGTLGGGVTDSDSVGIAGFQDINGDGLPDILLNDNGVIKNIINKTGRTNLLKSVSNPLGGRITVDYERKGNTFDMPQSKFVMKSMQVEDGKGHSYQYKYTYNNGKHDRGEREFYGFANVTEIMPDGSSQETVYSTESFYRKGLETLKTIIGSDRSTFTVTEKTYTDRVTDSDRSCFVQLVETRTEYHEGMGSAQITSAQQYEYDQYGNVSRFKDLGDVSDGSDNITAEILYEYRAANYLMAMPVQITVTDGQGGVLRQRSASYDHKGNLRTITQVSGNETSTTSMDYFDDGNLKLVTLPPNDRSQRYGLKYTYDGDVQTYVTAVEDVFGLTSQTMYDVKHGVPLITSDTNGNMFYYNYDSFGRTTRIVGPYDAGGYTISYSYYIGTDGARCVTRNRGYWQTGEYIDTTVTIDGLKRVVSTAVTSEVNGSKGYTVSGAVEYDEMGRVIKQGQPQFNGDGTPAGMINPTLTDYDPIGRKLRVEMPDGTSVNYAYLTGTQGGKNTLVTRVIDQLGRIKTTHRDVRDNIVAVTEPGGITTAYQYSALGEIEKITDADGNVTTSAYDRFGRRTEINNPDTGRTIFTYDLAGNMTRKITAELSAKGKAIRYHYDHNRLVQIDYPYSDDVYYTYGSAGSGNNRAGRLYRTDNGTVSEELYFGRLGETVKSVKTIKDGDSSATYTTKYAFDNMGRMRTLTYPDGEVLTYGYGHGGLLKSAIGESTAGKKVYLENMLYDEFGQRTKAKYGNGAESTYTYEPVMRRLQNLKTTSSDGKVLQNIDYKYDNVGNITNRKNSDFSTVDDIKRNSEQSYAYDNHDRLKTSSGKFDYETWNPLWNKRVNTYTNEFEYNVTGKILRKNQQNTGLIADTNTTETIAETTYDWTYEYTGPHQNAVTKAGTRTMAYDLNGNMTSMTDTNKSVTRTLTWNEENRLKQTTDASGTNSIVTTYEYDAAGTRVLKKGKYGTVQYVSDNYTVRNKDLISKHVFAGNTRLVSKVVMQEEKSGKMVATEQGSYYYHADHLGSSSVVTDVNGKFYEQIEYFPYGETWVHNKASSTQTSTPYKFTSKELDEETGLYYYGARYYDAKLSRWISADDRFDDLFSTQGHDVFAYVHNNPVRYNDPTGHVTEIADQQNRLGADQTFIGSLFSGDSSGSGKSGGGEKAKNKSGSPDATIIITSTILKNDKGTKKGSNKESYGMSGNQHVEFTENGEKTSFDVDVKWLEMDKQEGKLNYEYPTRDGSGTLSYNPKSKNGMFHLSASGHPESGIFIHPGYWSEGCGMLGKDKDPGVQLYWKMVDMLKNGKRIDYEFRRFDARKPEEIEIRPIPKGE